MSIELKKLFPKKICGMCAFCQFLIVYNNGYRLGVEYPTQSTEWEKDKDGNYSKTITRKYKWLSPEELKQGHIDKRGFEYLL